MSKITHASHTGLPIPPVFVASLLSESFSLWGGMTACQCCPTATSWGGYPAEGVGDLHQSLSLFEFYVTAAYETVMSVSYLNHITQAILCSIPLLFTPVVLVVVSVFHSVIVHSCCFSGCLSVPFSYCSLLLCWSLSQCSTQLLFTPVVLVVVSLFHSVIVHCWCFGRSLSVPLSYCSLLSFWSLSQCSIQLLFTADVLGVVSVFHSVIVHLPQFPLSQSTSEGNCPLWGE